jgi:hypothetical protein
MQNVVEAQKLHFALGLIEITNKSLKVIFACQITYGINIPFRIINSAMH